MSRALRFHSLRGHFILKKMIKKTILFLLLILGCQKNWLDSEKNDFKARCNNPDIILEEIYYDSVNFKNKTNKLTVNKEERAIFCDCILSQLLLLDLSYDDFLEKDLKTLDTQNDISISQITNACPVE